MLQVITPCNGERCNTSTGKKWKAQKKAISYTYWMALLNLLNLKILPLCKNKTPS